MTFLAKKSMPTVGLVIMKNYMGSLLKLVVDILLDHTGLSDGLIAKKNNFDFCLSCQRTY